MKTQHTPAPWQSSDCVVYVGTREQPRWIAKISKCETRLSGGNVTRQGIGDRERDANARLIAAAPELLDMLKALHKNRKELPTEMQWQRASELIAKAEGGVS